MYQKRRRAEKAEQKKRDASTQEELDRPTVVSSADAAPVQTEHRRDYQAGIVVQAVQAEAMTQDPADAEAPPKENAAAAPHLSGMHCYIRCIHTN